MGNWINSCKCRNLVQKRTSKDITCYKVIERRNGKAYSLFGWGIYKDGVKEGTLLIPEEKIKHNNWIKRILFNKPKVEKIPHSITYNKERNWYDITWGFIHSLPYNIEGKLKQYIPIDCKGTFELWECIIPKGTVYYQADVRGSHYEASYSYASKQLKFIRMIESIKYKGYFNEE